MTVLVIPPARFTFPVDATEHLDELHEALKDGVEHCIWLLDQDDASSSFAEFKKAVEGTPREAFLGHPDRDSYSTLLAHFAITRPNSQVPSEPHVIDLSTATGDRWSTSMWAQIGNIDFDEWDRDWSPDPTNWYKLGKSEKQRRLDQHDRALAATCQQALIFDQYLCHHLFNFAVMQRFHANKKFSNGTGRKLRSLREMGVPTLSIYATFGTINKSSPAPEARGVIVTLSRVRESLPVVGWENRATPAGDPSPTDSRITHTRRLAYAYLTVEPGAPQIMVQFDLPDGLQGYEPYEPKKGEPADSVLVTHQSDRRFSRNLQGFTRDGCKTQPIRCTPATGDVAGG